MTSHVGGIFWAMYYGEENYSIVSLYCCNKYSMFTLNMSNVKLIPRLEPSHHQASVVVSCCPIRDRDPCSRDTSWPISGGYPWTRQTNYQLSPWHPFISFPLQHTAAATAQLSFSSRQSVPVSVTARTLTLELMRPFQTGTLLQSQCSSWFADLLITELVCDTL